MFSAGRISRNAAATVSPPMPLSNTPIGGNAVGAEGVTAPLFTPALVLARGVLGGGGAGFALRPVLTAIVSWYPAKESFRSNAPEAWSPPPRGSFRRQRDGNCSRQ